MASIEIKDNEISAALDQARQTALQPTFPKWPAA